MSDDRPPMICATMKEVDGDAWISRWVWKGERLRLDMPEGRVTLRYGDINANGDVFLTVTYERIRQGLCRFERPAVSGVAASNERGRV